MSAQDNLWECQLCFDKFPEQKRTKMLECSHSCCTQCAAKYFHQQISEKGILFCVCPFCKLPDIKGSNILEADKYFEKLYVLLKNISTTKKYELFDCKLRDWVLSQDPCFKWCIKCTSGFIFCPDQTMIKCPDCGTETCAQCQRVWEKQHDGISCEKFLDWKSNNNPDKQAAGLARHLKEYGIRCPRCNVCFSLSSGGCMHLTCNNCAFEFCADCKAPFLYRNKCKVSPDCANMGLHSHHPRNCLYYLREKEPHELQHLLKSNNVDCNTQPLHDTQMQTCTIVMQAETDTGFKDEFCKREVSLNHGGLCREHYIEYLVKRVSESEIDPLPIMDLKECVQELRRHRTTLPERGPYDTDDIYLEMCRKTIRERLPLTHTKSVCAGIAVIDLR